MKHLFRLLGTLTLICLSKGLFAQDCGCNQCQIPIQADYTRDFYLDVAGASFNDLSTPQQGLCEVEIDFAHDFLSDLKVTLISPAGQSVQLIRDVNPNDTTYFSRWKIKFKPCADPVLPDPGMLAGFDDNTNWPKNGSFSGQYYSATGCLEDFNTGTVNGRWTLKVQSQNLRGVGYIFGFKLKFCQQQGIVCAGLTYDLAAGEGCSNAAEFPPNLSNYIGSTAGFAPSGVPNFCGEIDNDQWFKFVAKCTDITIQVTPGACVNGAGIQIALYDYCGGPAIACEGGCQDCGWEPLTINANLVMGEEYYFLIDGWAGDLCDYEFSIPPGCLGGIGDPHISEVPTGCEGNVYGATLVSIPFSAAGYIWTASNGALVNGQSQVTIPGPGNTSVEVTLGNGVSEICVAAYNFTDTTEFFCQSIEADTNLFLVETGIICYDEGPFYSQYGQYGVPPLDFPGTHQFSLFDYPDENGDPYPCPVTLGIHLTLEGGFTQLPGVVSLGDTYTLPNGEIVSESGFFYWSDTLPSGCRLEYAQLVHLIGWEQHGDGCAPDTVTVEMPSSNAFLECPGGFPPVVGGGGTKHIVYQNPGVFDLIGRLTGQFFPFEDTVKINFLPPVMASFSLALMDPITVQLQNTSQNATTYLWNFGDGASSTEFAPIHSYGTSGTFIITLTATGPCGAKTFTQIVSIQGPAPQTAFLALQTEGCSPFVVQYQDQSQGTPSSWSWTFPGGTPSSSTAQNPSVTYSNPGIYSATLSASNSFGMAISTQTNLITVHPPTEADFGLSVQDFSITLVNNSQNTTDYTWNFGDGNTTTDFSPTHTYTTPGTYSIVLIANGLCGPDTSIQSVTITAPALQVAFLATPNSGCIPLVVQFQDQTQGNPTSWNWSFPGGTPASSTEQNPTVMYSNPGVYDATLSASNGFGSAISTQTNLITVHPPTEADFGLSVQDFSITLVNNSQNATAYHWDFGDGNTTTDFSPTHTYTAPGTYLIELIANGLCGTDTSIQSVTITAPALQVAFLATPSSGCIPLPVQFQDQTQGNPTSWNWSFPGGTPASSTEQNPTVLYFTTDTFDVSLTVGNAFGSGTITQTDLIITAPLPSVAFGISVSNLEISLSNQSQNANNYIWDFGDGVTSTETNPQHTYAAPGDYLVTLQAKNNCGTSVLQQWVTVLTTGAPIPGEIAWLRIAPNPSDGHFQLEVQDQPSSSLSWRLFNALGQQIAARQLGRFDGHYHESLHFADLPSALYWLEVRTGEKRSWLKLIVE